MSDPVAKKSLGQHWLNDQPALEAICAGASLGSDDIVLEVGPGPGSLTRLLLEKAAKVVAIEKDERLAASLIAKPNLEVVTGDILDFDLSKMPRAYKLVANIPYYLTSNLIRKLSESSNAPAVAVLLIQKEVAERVAASPGQMSILAATAQFYWQVSLGRVVEASLFRPPPKVDSQILVLERREKPLFDVDTKIFFKLVKAGFSQKRKTLTNSLSASYRIDKKQTIEWLEKSGINPTARAQTLSLENWHELYENISNN